MAVASISNYKSREEIKEKYSTRGIASHFIFEQRLYEYVGTEKAFRRIIHTYRCEEERHNVKIYVRAGIVLDVRAFYQIEALCNGYTKNVPK